MSAKGIAEGFVVAQPLGFGVVPLWFTAAGTPESEQDVAFARALVDDVASRVTIDPDRVYATGFSNGGGMANRLACDAADVFAAIGAVAGAYVDFAECAPSRPVPIIAFHGTLDLVVPYEGFLLVPDVRVWAEAWSARNGCTSEPDIGRIAADVTLHRWSDCREGADVLLYTIEGGGHGWPGTSSPTRRENSTDSVDATELIWDFFEVHPLP